MSPLMLVLLVLVVLALAGGGWGFYSGGPYGPWYGGLGLVMVVILIVFLLMNRL